jgi:hypothetical protein
MVRDAPLKSAPRKLNRFSWGFARLISWLGGADEDVLLPGSVGT